MKSPINNVERNHNLKFISLQAEKRRKLYVFLQKFDGTNNELINFICNKTFYLVNAAISINTNGPRTNQLTAFADRSQNT